MVLKFFIFVFIFGRVIIHFCEDLLCQHMPSWHGLTRDSTVRDASLSKHPTTSLLCFQLRLIVVLEFLILVSFLEELLLSFVWIFLVNVCHHGMRLMPVPPFYQHYLCSIAGCGLLLCLSHLFLFSFWISYDQFLWGFIASSHAIMACTSLVTALSVMSAPPSTQQHLCSIVGCGWLLCLSFFIFIFIKFCEDLLLVFKFFISHSFLKELLLSFVGNHCIITCHHYMGFMGGSIVIDISPFQHPTTSSLIAGCG